MNVQVTRRTRFKYMIDDRVRVIATERTGVVEACNPDPEQRPYLVRLDPRTLQEYQQPERAAFHEEALERNLSPAFTVVFVAGQPGGGGGAAGEGVADGRQLLAVAGVAGDARQRLRRGAAHRPRQLRRGLPVAAVLLPAQRLRRRAHLPR